MVAIEPRCGLHSIKSLEVDTEDTKFEFDLQYSLCTQQVKEKPEHFRKQTLIQKQSEHMTEL